MANATKQDILDIINTKKFSEIFLFDKDFTALLGGITKNSTNHIIGAKATILRFYGQIDLDAITEVDKKSSGYGPPVSLKYRIFERARFQVWENSHMTSDVFWTVLTYLP